MTTKKTLSVIHITRAMALLENFEKGETQLELIATYLAPASTLVKSTKNPEAMAEFIAQAAELPGEEGAELMADFLEQFGKYSGVLNACGLLHLEVKKASPEPSQETPEA